MNIVPRSRHGRQSPESDGNRNRRHLSSINYVVGSSHGDFLPRLLTWNINIQPEFGKYVVPAELLITCSITPFRFAARNDPVYIDIGIY